MSEKFSQLSARINSSENWYDLPMECFSDDFNWLTDQYNLFSDFIFLNLGRKDLAAYIINCYRTIHRIRSDLIKGEGYFAVMLFRPLIERISIIKKGLALTKQDFGTFLDGFKSQNRSDRQRTTEELIDDLDSSYPGVKHLFNDISRYFSHVSIYESFTDKIAGKIETAHDYITEDGNIHPNYAIYYMVAYDLQNLFCNFIDDFLKENDSEYRSIPREKNMRKKEKPLTNQIVALIKRIYLDDINQNSPIEFRTLIHNLEGLPKIGINSVYRNRMAITVYAPHDTYDHLKLKGLAVFATDDHNISEDPDTRIYFRGGNENRSKYEIYWSKKYKYTKTLLLLVAGNLKEPLPALDLEYIKPLLDKLTDTYISRLTDKESPHNN